MDGEPGSLVQLREVRERTIELLSSHYAHDLLEVDEFERRVELAERAESVAELEELIADLEPAPAALAVARPAVRTTALARPEDVAPTRTLVSFFGGTTRKGVWAVPRKLKVWTVFGGTNLDFREAQLAPGANVVKLYTVFGGAEILVPPNLHVEVDGSGIFGAFDGEDSVGRPAGPDEPYLLIQGFAAFGGVDVKERLPGESAREARRRRKREQKELAARRKRELAAADRKRLGPKP